jgi:hypothetical protein
LFPFSHRSSNSEPHFWFRKVIEKWSRQDMARNGAGWQVAHGTQRVFPT